MLTALPAPPLRRAEMKVLLRMAMASVGRGWLKPVCKTRTPDSGVRCHAFHPALSLLEDTEGSVRAVFHSPQVDLTSFLCHCFTYSSNTHDS